MALTFALGLAVEPAWGAPPSSRPGSSRPCDLRTPPSYLPLPSGPSSSEPATTLPHLTLLKSYRSALPAHASVPAQLAAPAAAHGSVHRERRAGSTSGSPSAVMPPGVLGRRIRLRRIHENWLQGLRVTPHAVPGVLCLRPRVSATAPRARRFDQLHGGLPWLLRQRLAKNPSSPSAGRAGWRTRRTRAKRSDTSKSHNRNSTPPCISPRPFARSNSAISSSRHSMVVRASLAEISRAHWLNQLASRRGWRRVRRLGADITGWLSAGLPAKSSYTRMQETRGGGKGLARDARAASWKRAKRSGDSLSLVAPPRPLGVNLTNFPPGCTSEMYESQTRAGRGGLSRI